VQTCMCETPVAMMARFPELKCIICLLTISDIATLCFLPSFTMLTPQLGVTPELDSGAMLQRASLSSSQADDPARHLQSLEGQARIPLFPSRAFLIITSSKCQTSTTRFV
jgi:hypothetical protein